MEEQDRRDHMYNHKSLERKEGKIPVRHYGFIFVRMGILVWWKIRMVHGSRTFPKASPSYCMECTPLMTKVTEDPCAIFVALRNLICMQPHVPGAEHALYLQKPVV